VKRVKLADVLLSEQAFGHAVSDLGRAAGFDVRLLSLPTPPAEALEDPLLLDRWVEATADYFGVEAESVETTFRGVEGAVGKLAPALVRVPRGGGGFGVLVILESSPKELVVLLPGLVRRRVATAELVEALRARIRGNMAELLDEWTRDLPLAPKARARAYAALLHEVAGGESIGGMWLLRPRPGAPLLGQLRHSGDVVRVIAFVVLTIVQIVLGLLGWSSLFDAALTGRLEASPLWRWVLLSLTMALVEIVRSFFVGRLNVSVAALLKRRVLAGALHLDPNEIRARGSGGILALISEAEVLETAGLSSLVSVVSAAISLISAAFVLSRGAGGLYHVGLLAAWSLVIAVAMVALNKRSRRWIDFRLGMTNRLVERMVGHRTRMAQERHDGRHKPEDAELELYLAESRGMDALARVLQGLPSRGWLLLGFLFLLPSLWSGTAEVGALLVAIGGLFQAQSAFSDIAGSIAGLLNLTVAWSRAGMLFKAAATQEPHGLPAASVQEVGAARRAAKSEGVDDDAGALLEARAVRFRYRTTGEQILKGVSLRVAKGDRLLIEGPSGGGKSTLAALLAGLRAPDSGMVVHHGLDRATLGTSTWRRKVASVPQFHENHILSGSLLYNLCLGRRWPATSGDRDAAERVCVELGLGPLLDRMPARLEQVVGETGWQLSHGEKTRVFLARALLQGAEVVLVDESFGALDPHTLRTSIDATWNSSETLLVIAHP
jgi:ATP-binding cassette subfamily B protein